MAVSNEFKKAFKSLKSEMFAQLVTANDVQSAEASQFAHVDFSSSIRFTQGVNFTAQDRTLFIERLEEIFHDVEVEGRSQQTST
jgi:hypothetical protein